MNPVRVGVLGTGTVVRDFHLPALVANPRARVVAIGNLRIPSAQRLADRFGVNRILTEFDRMARDPEIDAVVIALPNSLHAPVAVEMLRGGKHVLCEKPMAMSVAEARAMTEAAKAAGRKLMIAHVWRMSPQVQWLRQVLESGRLGKISRVKAHAVVAGRGPDPESWFVQPEMAGGGALIDVGIHSIDTISFLFDDQVLPVKVTARLANHFKPFAVEDTASVQIEYDNGMTAELEAGWFHEQAASPHGAVELFGSRGYGRTLPPLWNRLDGTTEEVEPAILSKHPDHDRSVYDTQIDHFLDCVLEDRQPACDGEQGTRDMMVVETAYRAARNGTSLAIEPQPGIGKGQESL